MKRSTMIQKGNDILDRPDVAHYAKARFEEAGISETDMFELHAKHMKGELTKTVLNREGEKVEVNLPPSVAALLAAEKMVLPAQPHKVESKVAIGIGLMGSGPPDFAARALPEKVVEQVEEGDDGA
jgi:hypothetical protein